MKFLMMLLISTATFAGRESGNGGYAHVCRNKKGKIISARLLDLWEGSELATWKSSDSYEDQVERAMKRIKEISPKVFNAIGTELKDIEKGMRFTNRKLTKTKDALPPYENGKGCEYEQVARYESSLLETGKRGLKVNREIYKSKHFSESDRAGLLVHEAIYLLDRNQNDSITSLKTRRINAHIFSDKIIPNSIRLELMSLVNRKTRYDGDLFIKSQTFAVQEPNLVNFDFVIGSVDSLPAFYGHGDAKQMEGKYRCVASYLGVQPLADSGWISLTDILRLDSPEKPRKSVSGSYQTFFRGEDYIGEGHVIESIEFNCYFKTNDEAESVEVDFSGYFKITDAVNCLSQLRDGSNILSQGDDCAVPVSKNLVDESDHSDILIMEFARAK